MKLLKNLISKTGLLAFFTFAMAFSLSCCKEDELEKWVDLRYRVNDSYTLDSKGLEAEGNVGFSFFVKSTAPWEVVGTPGQDWYTLSPQSGEAGEKYEVTFICKENKDLDDRIDTLSIRSDYWTGKQFVVTQQGIAYLKYESNVMIPKQGGEASFQVKSNQKWTAKVTSGESWLSIVSGDSGEFDGEVTVKTDDVNKGERRIGQVTLYDRHGVVRQIVDCPQYGVVLVPAVPENGKWFALEHQAQVFTIPVEADGEWEAVKDNEEDDWFDIAPGTSMNQLVINVKEHTGEKVREAKVYLMTKAAEGTDPVRKEVKFKQINPLTTYTTEVGREIVPGNGFQMNDAAHGKYLFYLKPPLTAGTLSITLAWDGKNMQYNIINGVAKGQTVPWNNMFNKSNDPGPVRFHRTLDKQKDNVVGFTVEENADETPSVGNMILYVNDEVVGNMKEIPGFMYNPKEMFWEQICMPGKLTVVCTGGGAAFLDKVEFTPPLDWGE